MRILVLGAGAIGGYFGARLLEAGIDVTFLVRPARAVQLLRGLRVRSPQGNLDLSSPALVTATTVTGGYDLIVLSCKAYDLEDALDSIAPAVDARCAILPLLNGMGHMDRLRARFGNQAVLGGTCLVSVTLDPAGTILHLSDLHQITFGEWDGSRSARIEAVAAAFAKARMQSVLSESIVQDMWEKWVMIASSAASTCLMRAAIGDIVKAGGVQFILNMFEDCARIAAANGHSLRPTTLARAQAMLTARDSLMTASMLRDMEHGGRIEADHIVGDLLELAEADAAMPMMLQLAQLHLKSYEQRRAREANNVVSPGQ